MTRESGHRPGLVSAMLEPGFYPDGPGSVELRETHISWVFLVGDRAYKVKKPLALPFLDYGTVERRHEMCRDEVRLNRRLAPSIYLRVVAIVRAGEGFALAHEDDPAAVEYAVEMRRVQERRSLAALAAAGELAAAHVSATATLLARFHADAPSVSQSIDVLEATLEENVTTLREAGAELLDLDGLAGMERFTASFLAARRSQLEERSRAGLIRDGHGDLRAEHVIVPEGGEIYVYDCVEFNPELRRIDVSADLAFLVMDLLRLGVEERALELLDAYRAAGGDPGDDPLLFFFASYRAWVRAKVACLRAGELTEADHDRDGAIEEARQMVDLGHRMAWLARRPLVLVVCGVSGSGKTTLAGEVARRSGWAHLSSDVMRKGLAGLEASERGDAELYSPEATVRTYRGLGAAAADAVRRDGAAIVDATFHLREERDAFRAGLGDPAIPVIYVECRASPATLRARVRDRELDPARISDAGVAVLDLQLAEREPVDEVPAQRWAEILTESSPQDLAGEVEALIDARLWRSPGGRENA